MGSAEFALPAGTVTFLLTDVEGSTGLWEERRDDMADAIVQHYEILDGAIAAAGGVRPVEQGEGDSVVAAFARVADAVRAAVDSQRRLQAELPWLAVRMAIHTGEAEFRDDGNYIGRTIIRCARLRSCAHGGQVVVSEAAAALFKDAMPEGVELISLGVARLRDLSRREHVWQLCHAELRATFPPLRSLDAAAHNLPTPLTSFIGREAEQQEVLSLLRNERLVTITGSGGAGKTRLALQVAAGGVEGHRDGTWWVELASISAGAEVAERVATAARVVLGPGVDPLDVLVRRWSNGGEVLVVLDNAEHVVEAVAATAERLLGTCPGLRILVTSREPLGVPGEVIWRVPSLSSPESSRSTSMSLESLNTFDSVRLFIERARHARPNLVVDDAAAPHIASICARLDGIPLAIELAAARTRSMPLERIASGLSDAFRLLTGGARTVLPRQQTLLASIAWSVDALDDAERNVFRRLAVFQTRFTLDAAEAVAADGQLVESVMVLDIVARLVDKSLVILDDATGRYALLETVRQFGLDRLRDTGELADSRDRHAGWFAQWSEQVGRGLHGLGNDRILDGMPDAVAALEWSYDTDVAVTARICAGLSWFRAGLGSYPSLVRQCDWLIEFDRSRDPTSWAIAVAGTALSAFVSQRTDFFALIGDARELLAPDDRYHRRLLDFPFAVMQQLHGDDARITEIIDEAAVDGDDITFLVAAGASSFASLRSGYFADVRRRHQQTEEILQRHGTTLTADNSAQMVLAVFELAVLSGQFDQASAIMSRAGTTRSGSAFMLAASTAYLALMAGDLTLATNAAAQIDRDAPPVFAPLAHYVHCFAARLEQRWVDAAEHGMQGWAGMRSRGVTQGLVHPAITASLLACGRPHDARAHVEDWRTDVERLGQRPLHRATLHYSSALVHLATGDDGPALDDAHIVVDLAHEHGFTLLLVDAIELIADIAARRDNNLLAARLLGAVRAMRERLGYVAYIRSNPDAAAQLETRTAKHDPDAFAAGAALSPDDMVELAQRARGERNRPTHGWDSLTPTEHRVVELVAAGLASAQIAQRLLMRTSTVKTHLTHIFTKLGINNRTELASVAHRHQTQP